MCKKTQTLYENKRNKRSSKTSSFFDIFVQKKVEFGTCYNWPDSLLRFTNYRWKHQRYPIVRHSILKWVQNVQGRGTATLQSHLGTFSDIWGFEKGILVIQ